MRFSNSLCDQLSRIDTKECPGLHEVTKEATKEATKEIKKVTNEAKEATNGMVEALKRIKEAPKGTKKIKKVTKRTKEAIKGTKEATKGTKESNSKISKRAVLNFVKQTISIFPISAFHLFVFGLFFVCHVLGCWYK